MAKIKGGEKLRRKLEDILAATKRASVVRVGFLRGATYPTKAGTTVALVAVVQDFGAPSRGIPPRPFFRNAIAKHKGEWPGELQKLLKAANYDAVKALTMMGDRMRGEVQQSIRDTNAPPLKPATIKRKGFAKPLIETSHMLNSVDFEVA